MFNINKPPIFDDYPRTNESNTLVDFTNAPAVMSIMMMICQRRLRDILCDFKFVGVDELDVDDFSPIIEEKMKLYK